MKESTSPRQKHLDFLFRITMPMTDAYDRLVECWDKGEEPPIEERDAVFAACEQVQEKVRTMARRCRERELWREAAYLAGVLDDVVAIEWDWRKRDMLDELPGGVPRDWNPEAKLGERFSVGFRPKSTVPGKKPNSICSSTTRTT